MLTGLCAGILLALTGCVGGGDGGFAVLDREATADDAVRDAVRSELPEYAESARFIGEHEGDRLYVLRTDRNLHCILVDPGEQSDGSEKWVTACGARGAVSSGRYGLVPDGHPIPTGATQISDNVYVGR